MADEKKLFITNLRNLMRAPKEVFRIINEQPLCNLRLVERASKSRKDPNPLMSTLNCINQKYPITIDKNRAFSFDVPREYFFLDDTKMKTDARNRRRVLCKRSAIDWWVEKSRIPEPQTIEAIDTLYAHHREQVKRYMSLNWKGGVRFGPVNFERKMIQTNNPVVNTSRVMREQALQTILFPYSFIPYEPVPEDILSKMKEFISNKLAARLTLPSQIVIILNQLDPKRRMLPTVPGISDGVGEIKHSIEGANHIMTGVGTPMANTSGLIVQHSDSIAKALVEHLKNESIPLDTAREIIRSITVKDVPFTVMVQDPACPDTFAVRIIKTILGYACKPEFTKNDFTTHPLPTRIQEYTKMNCSGTKYTIYLGQEVVNFKYNDVRGQLVKNGDNISKIRCNWTERTELTRLLQKIGAYCRYKFFMTKGKSLTECEIESERIVRKEIDVFLKCQSGSYARLIRIGPRKFPRTCGILELVEQSEYSEPHAIRLEVLYPSYALINPSNRRLIGELTNMKGGINLLPVTIKGKIIGLRPRLRFKTLVETLIRYYLGRYQELRGRIARFDFKWMNADVSKFIVSQSREFSLVCRTCMQQNMESLGISAAICFLYIFSHPDPTPNSIPVLQIYTNDNQVVDATCERGIFVYNTQAKEYMLFNVPLGPAEAIGRRRVTAGFLTGYKILNSVVPEAEVIPLQILEARVDSIQDGSVFNTFIEGKKLTVCRDSSQSAEIAMTLRRQAMAKMNSYSKIVFNLPKRKFIDSVSKSDVGAKDHKRKRLSEQGIEMLSGSASTYDDESGSDFEVGMSYESSGDEGNLE